MRYAMKGLMTGSHPLYLLLILVLILDLILRSADQSSDLGPSDDSISIPPHLRAPSGHHPGHPFRMDTGWYAVGPVAYLYTGGRGRGMP